MKLHEIAKLYKDLLQLSGDLIARQYQAKDTCNNGDIDTALQVLSYDNRLINRYDKLNEKINTGIQTLQTDLKISEEEFEDTIKASGDSVMQSILNLRESIKVKKEVIKNEKSEAINLVQQKAGELSRDIGDISQLKNFS